MAQTKVNKMKCEICGVSCFDKPLVRNNPKGETPAIWRCEEHSIEEMPDVAKIISGVDSGEKCPKCGSSEIEAMTPRTTYECGSSDYDQRPSTFKQSQACMLKCLPKMECPECKSDVIYNDRADQAKGVFHCDDCGHEAKEQDFIV
jgi:hypothetical protein